MQHQNQNYTPASKIHNSTTTMDLKDTISSIDSADIGASNEAQFELQAHRSTVWRRERGITTSRAEGYEKQCLLKAQDTKTLIEHINHLTL